MCLIEELYFMEITAFSCVYPPKFPGYSEEKHHHAEPLATTLISKCYMIHPPCPILSFLSICRRMYFMLPATSWLSPLLSFSLIH